MPKPRRRFLLISLAAVVVGLTVAAWLLWPRTRITRENATRIQVGMTLAEVETILGGPARDESTGPIRLDMREPDALVQEVRYDHAMVRHRPTCAALIWRSDVVTVAVYVAPGGRVAGCATVPMRRAILSPLDLLRHWLGL